MITRKELMVWTLPKFFGCFYQEIESGRTDSTLEGIRSFCNSLFGQFRWKGPLQIPGILENLLKYMLEYVI
jgi:hypothetical protein